MVSGENIDKVTGRGGNLSLYSAPPRLARYNSLAREDLQYVPMGAITFYDEPLV